MSNNPKYRKTNLYRYILSGSLLVISIILVISTLADIQIRRNRQEQFIAAHENALLQLSQSVDALLGNMQTISSNLASDYQLSPLFALDPGYNNYLAIKSLMRYADANPIISDVGIYYLDASICLTPHGNLPLETLLQRVYVSPSLNTQSLLAVFENAVDPVFISVPSVSLYGKGKKTPTKNYTLAVYPIPLQGNRPTRFALFWIDNQNINTILELANMEGIATIAVATSAGDVLLSTTPKEGVTPFSELLAVSSQDDSLFQTDTTTTVKDNKEALVFRRASSYSQFRCSIAVPHKLFASISNPIRGNFVFAVALVTGLALLCSLLLSYRNYRPIKKIADSIVPENELPPKEGSLALTDIEWIQQQVKNIKFQNDSLRDDLHSKQSLLKRQALLELLQTPWNSSPAVLAVLQAQNITLTKPKFQVILFELSNSTALPHVTMVYLKTITEELFSGCSACYTVEGQRANLLCCLLNDTGQALLEGDVEQLVAMLRTEMGASFGCTITAAVSGVKNDMELIHTAYLESLTALEYQLILNKNVTFFYNTLSPQSSVDALFFSVMGNTLKATLFAGEFEKSEKLLNDIVSKLENQRVSPTTLPFFSYHIYSVIHSVIHALALPSEYQGALDTILQEDNLSLHSIAVNYLSICKDICLHRNSFTSSRHDILLDDIAFYIEENYQNSNLTLKQIAERFGLTPSYVTRFYKEKTGTTIMRTVDEYRIKKAKQLLLESALPIGQLLEQAGYVNRDNFQRKFKKQEGLTPTEYRSLHSMAAPD